MSPDLQPDEADDVAALFHAAIESFPGKQQEAARQRLAEWEAALKLIREIEMRGLEALQ